MKTYLHLLLISYFLLGFSLTLPAQRKIQAYVDYANRYSNIAIKHRDQYRIPASITLAQGILESGAGASELARASNNHFGIKCHSDWTGERVYRRDDGPNDCFRKYRNVEESYEDHAKFLQQHQRYAVLFTYDTRDYKAWARGLQTSGYATDRGYANKLIQLIETYELYKYDSKTPQKTIEPPIEEKKKKTELLRDVYRAHNLLYIIAKDNDSFKLIADETGFKVKNLAKFNDVPENFPLRKGDIVYLEKKKKKADLPNFEHLVKVGESMHSISQRYGIQLKYLYKMNKKGGDFIPTEEDVLRLR
jgi:LysM repeat protein